MERFVRAGVVAVAAAVCGCGDESPRTGATVEGTVRRHGSPVTAGTVRLVSADGEQVAAGPITPHGRYTVRDAPVGLVSVLVDAAAGGVSDSAALINVTVWKQRYDIDLP